MRPLPFTTTALSLTATVLPAIVTVVLRADPELAEAETVTDPLPVPPAVFRLTHVLDASLAVLQLQPLPVVTVTLFEPPPDENESEVVETL